jgi:hypothetical protein
LEVEMTVFGIIVLLMVQIVQAEPLAPQRKTLRILEAVDEEIRATCADSYRIFDKKTRSCSESPIASTYINACEDFTGGRTISDEELDCDRYNQPIGNQ